MAGPGRVLDLTVRLATMRAERTATPAIPSPHLAILHSLSAELRTRVIGFEDLHIRLQVETLRDLRVHTPDVSDVLLAAAVERKLSDPRYAKLKPTSVDPTVDKVVIGQVVDCWYEAPVKGDISRSMADFRRLVAADVSAGIDNVDLIGVDLTHVDVQRLRLEDTQGLGLLPPSEEDASGNVIQITGLLGLLTLLHSRPDHPAFSYGAKAIRILTNGISPLYEMRHACGVVSGFLPGVIQLDTGEEIEKSSIRTMHIVGADENLLLNKDENELFYGKRIRFWHEGAWRKGTIIKIGTLLTVLADENIGSNRNLDGREFTIGRDAEELDLRDPEATEEKDHPLKKYPNIYLCRSVVIIEDGQRILGVIDRICANDGFYYVSTVHGRRPVSFDEVAVEYLPKISESESKHPGIFDGARLMQKGIEGTRRPVYKIVAIDHESRMILIEKVSFHPDFSDPKYCYISFESSRYELLGDGEAELERFPLLRSFGYPKPVVRFRWNGEVLEGEVFKLEPLPAYLQVLRRKEEHELPSDDVYHRYDVSPEDILDVFEP